ncbi:PREDICTED: uncharacterized protein LOC106786899 [Polistes canadensis]|uniref:uncharacterized protein LOC106786899 n=1 Tax=Polistes canadensis TaxID=91411 RepID=UPI000718BB15|nr:PREDICTED: uncharacterized protein LOC106786899 [Polistes canadensis]
MGDINKGLCKFYANVMTRRPSLDVKRYEGTITMKKEYANWAKIVVSLERAVSQKDAHNYLQEYSIKLGPGDDPNNPACEQRGVLIIKSKSKTRAKQRKGAVSNWKRVGKVTITELKKRGMTGEELRQIMWGRESFSTPVRASPNVGGNNNEVSALTAGFGDALTAALDVMAFAHDLDLSADTTEGIPAINVTDKQQTKMQAKVPNSCQSITNVQVDSKTKLPTLTTFSDLSNNFVEKPIETINVPIESKLSKEEDPFLKLIIASELTNDEELLPKLAKDVLEVAEKSVKMTKETTKSKSQILEGLALIMAPTNVENSVPKKQYFVESSDNDLCTNEKGLGTESYLRRIRSANNRFMKSRKKSGRKPGNDSSSSSSSSSTSTSASMYVDENIIGYRSLLNGPEEEPTKRIPNKDRKKSVETIKDEVEQNGASCNPLEDKPQKRRPKTARNRVSPKEEPIGKRESIERNKIPFETTTTTTTTTMETETTTDPLEPWSTRGIKDMNAILAWKENTLDSP